MTGEDRGVLYWNPDSFTLDFVNGYSSRQIIENLILTFPMSCVLPFLVSIQNRRRFLVTVLLSFSIEWIQLLGCMLGISLHSFDIKDIILDVTGGIAGYGLFWMFCRGMSRLAQIASVSPYCGRGRIPLVLQVVRNCAQGKSSLEGVGLTAGAGRRNLRDNGEGTS